jgi:hypothetical protein
MTFANGTHTEAAIPIKEETALPAAAAELASVEADIEMDVFLRVLLVGIIR